MVNYLIEHDLSEDAGDSDTSRTAVYVFSGKYEWSAPPEADKALVDAIAGANSTLIKVLGHFLMPQDPTDSNVTCCRSSAEPWAIRRLAMS